eukprot:3887681-Lingulodinium_polyedra.AAC.1
MAAGRTEGAWGRAGGAQRLEPQRLVQLRGGQREEHVEKHFEHPLECGAWVWAQAIEEPDTVPPGGLHSNANDCTYHRKNLKIT